SRSVSGLCRQPGLRFGTDRPFATFLGSPPQSTDQRPDTPLQGRPALFAADSGRENPLMDIHNIARVPAFTTKDGSEIRELLAHRNSCIQKQSLAEARLPPGAHTTPHYHPVTEEIYYILAGTGRMTIGEETREVGPGDSI